MSATSSPLIIFTCLMSSWSSYGSAVLAVLTPVLEIRSPDGVVLLLLDPAPACGADPVRGGGGTACLWYLSHRGSSCLPPDGEQWQRVVRHHAPRPVLLPEDIAHVPDPAAPCTWQILASLPSSARSTRIAYASEADFSSTPRHASCTCPCATVGRAPCQWRCTLCTPQCTYPCIVMRLFATRMLGRATCGGVG